MNRLGGDDISDPGAIPRSGIAPGYKAKSSGMMFNYNCFMQDNSVSKKSTKTTK